MQWQLLLRTFNYEEASTNDTLDIKQHERRHDVLRPAGVREANEPPAAKGGSPPEHNPFRLNPKTYCGLGLSNLGLGGAPGG